MKKEKVLFLIESLIVGGAERVLIDIVNNLDANKFDITVCSIFKKSVYKGYNEYFDNPFLSHIHYRFLINNRIKWLYVLFNYLVVRIPDVIYRLFIGDKYDVVVAFYEGLPTSLIAGAQLKRGKKIAWLHTSTDLSQKGKSPEDLMRQEIIYSKFSKIVGVSHGVANSFSRLFHSQASKVTVIYNPINLDSIIQKSLIPVKITKPNCPLLVSVGRMTEAKGYERYLKVINRLNKSGYRFEVWIIGGGDITAFESYCKTHQLDNVSFLGNKTNPYPYMKMADWIVCPSLIEGLSTVVIESVALQKAILVTDCPGMREILGDSQYGMVVGNNSEFLDKGLKGILSRLELKEENEAKIKDRFLFFNVGHTISALEKCLIQI